MFNRFFYSIFAAVPFTLLMLFYQTNFQSISYSLFAYGGILFVAPIVLFFWIIYLGIERSIRTQFQITPTPWFSIFGFLFLVLFFVPGDMVKEFGTEFPELCRVRQGVEWKVPDSIFPEESINSFYLIVHGQGNEDHYRMEGGYLNWSGGGDAGLSDIKFSPIRFQNDYYESYRVGNESRLLARMTETGCKKEFLKNIASDMWNQMELAEAGRPLSPSLGTPDEFSSFVDGEKAVYVGGWIWMVVLFFVFQMVGFFLCKQTPDWYASSKKFNQPQFAVTKDSLSSH